MFTISQQSIKPIPQFSSFLGTLNKVPMNISIKKGTKNNKRRFLEKETNPYKIANFIFKEIAETSKLVSSLYDDFFANIIDLDDEEFFEYIKSSNFDKLYNYYRNWYYCSETVDKNLGILHKNPTKRNIIAVKAHRK